MKRATLYHKVKTYITHDLKEIIAPSSMPNPPCFVPPPKKTYKEIWKRLSVACQLYRDTWNPKLVDEHIRRERGDTPYDISEIEREKLKQEEKEESYREIMEGLGNAAKGGARTAIPYLQYLYRTRAESYREALKEFIVGYKEGFREAHVEDPLHNNDDKEKGGDIYNEQGDVTIIENESTVNEQKSSKKGDSDEKSSAV